MSEDASLRLSGQRALWGHVPPSLRAVSVGLEGNCIKFRAIFDRGATDKDKEHLSFAATEILADFKVSTKIKEEYIELAAPARMTHLEHLLFLRAEDAT